MEPRPRAAQTGELPFPRLDEQINISHPLGRLSKRMNRRRSSAVLAPTSLQAEGLLKRAATSPTSRGACSWLNRVRYSEQLKS